MVKPIPGPRSVRIYPARTIEPLKPMVVTIASVRIDRLAIVFPPPKVVTSIKSGLRAFRD